MQKKIEIRNGKDRLRYLITFELILVAMLTPLGSIVFEKELIDIGLLSVFLSLKAMLFGYFYNLLFDHVDAKAGRIPSHRSFVGRIIHAVGFELGLVMTSLPIVMWWLSLSLLQALIMDVAVTSIVVVYTFIFSYSYDWLFPVPQSNGA